MTEDQAQGKERQVGFEELAWLFTCDNRNRGILRMNIDEAALLWRCVRDIEGAILEIGRRHGGSTVLLCEAASNSRAVVSIDIAPQHHALCAEYFERREVRARLELLTQDSRLPLPGRRFGLAFIDGDHSYDGVRADTVAHWSALQAPPGRDALAVFHDAVPNPGLAFEERANHCEGVRVVCEQLVRCGAAEEVSKAGSLLVLRKLTELPEEFADLNEAAVEESAAAAERPKAHRWGGARFARWRRLAQGRSSRRVGELEDRVRELEAALGFVLAERENRWLYLNRVERMDATVEFFPDLRRDFHLDRYRFAAKHVAGKAVVDCASGTGYGVRLLRAEGEAAWAVGVDLDAGAVGYSNRRHKLDGTQFVCASGTAIPMDSGVVDVVTSFETLEHVEDADLLIGEFRRILKPRGVLIISTPNQWPLDIAPHHVQVYDRKALEKALHEGGFEVSELWNQNSGSDWVHNHSQARGIVRTTRENEGLAECFIAVCTRRG